jgi:collagenase-like PrtC family protease
MSSLRLSLAPIPWFWPRQQVLDFYRAARDWPVDIVYLGETVCGKRRELRTRDWIALAEELVSADREVVLSGLTLIEAEAELTTLVRLAEACGDRLGFEANDMSAVGTARQLGLRFVGGPNLNVYNLATLALLREDGMHRLVLGPDLGEARLAEWRADDSGLPEFEALVWGHPVLAHSARCFTARAYDLAKDECGLSCLGHPGGLPLATRDGARFLILNGIQVLGDTRLDLAPELHELSGSGISVLRLQPQAEGMAEVVLRFAAALESGVAPTRVGDSNGWWHGTAGMALR